MDPFLLPIEIAGPPEKIRYRQKILLTGSCFTEHIGNHLRDIKFDVLQNPNGILFDPLSVAGSLVSYIDAQPCRERDLVFLNELWQSWLHHGSFSDTSLQRCLEKINASRKAAQGFLKKADWLVITLGSAFSYTLTEKQLPVANCHRAPADWFVKKLLPVDEMLSAFDESIYRLRQFNPALKIVFTVSPVRHIRDGVINNNRSKARLLEVVHHFSNKFEKIYYFPAYELVIDVLRDYRFYDKDLVHPNYQATAFVLEHFMQNYVEPSSQIMAEGIKKIQIAYRHKALHPDTEAHRRFLEEQFLKTRELADKYPFLDFTRELAHFSADG
ncbi:MAG: GSCFA domain-containing protein [Bacteroidota bacterium]|nr:GSCFA domain-containing protein [Bacteroidota bacterium]MDP4211118.1 GSCFA domain-containing protein [Bacteroidota bacterium]MDP4249147.1 GSCFA domain-containing protein [Bacteroidota bacterium]